MPQLNTHTMESEAKAAVGRDIARRKMKQLMEETQQQLAEEARGKPWAETLRDLQREENRILSSQVMALGLLKASCEKHIELQQRAATAATAHSKPNPIVSMLGGNYIPADAQLYMLKMLDRAAKALKSGAGLTKDGLGQP